MATFTTRSTGAWLAAFFLAAPALAQTRVVSSVQGLSAPVAPVVGVQAAVTGAGAVASPISFSAASFNAAPSAPDAASSRVFAPAAAMPAPAAAATQNRVEAAAVPAPSIAHETASSLVSHVRPVGAREAAAVATVEGGIADWSARAPQTLGAAPVRAAASMDSELLKRFSARQSALAAAREPSPPVTPAPSKLKTFFSWAGPILALTTLVLGADFGSKFYAVHHLFHMFHEVAWRKPIILGMIPYILYTSWAARSKLAYDRNIRNWSIAKVFNGHWGFYQGDTVSGMNAMIQDHPSLKWAVRIYDVSIALMLGGMLGNGIDTIRLNGAMDWIPLGRSLMNFADVAVILGLSYFQASTNFFLRAGAAHKAGKALYFPYAFFLGLPIAGVFAAWAFGSAAGGGALDLAMKNVGFLYLMAFSMLIGAGRFVGMAVVNIFVKRFVADESLRAAASDTKA